MMNTEDLTERAAFLADFIAHDFVTLARHLRQLQDEKPDIVMKVAELAGISRRKCYSLIRISRQFDDLGIPEARLMDIGWTRLQIIGRYLSPDNAMQLLAMAEENTVHDLQLLLRGDTPVENPRVTVLYLSAEDHAKLATVLVSLGAAPNGNGLIGIEPALMRLVNLHTGG